MSSQPNPHDAVFRLVLGEPANAASQLRAVLPHGLASRLDFRRLTQVSGSFIDATLRWRHSDLLFTVPIDGREAFIYVLIEHQSSEDPLMPFRMLRYVLRIWDRYLADHPEASRLPVVIPLVVHHNRRPWTSSSQLEDLLDLGRGHHHRGAAVPAPVRLHPRRPARRPAPTRRIRAVRRPPEIH